MSKGRIRSEAQKAIAFSKFRKIIQHCVKTVDADFRPLSEMSDSADYSAYLAIHADNHASMVATRCRRGNSSSLGVR